MDSLRNLSDRFIQSFRSEKLNKKNIAQRAGEISKNRSKLTDQATKILKEVKPDMNTMMNTVIDLQHNQAKLNKEMVLIENKMNTIRAFFSSARKDKLNAAKETLNQHEEYYKLNSERLTDKATKEIKKSLDQGELFTKFPGETEEVLFKLLHCRDLIKTETEYTKKFDASLLQFIASKKNPGLYLNLIPKDIVLPISQRKDKSELMKLQKQLLNLNNKLALKKRLNKKMNLEGEKGITEIESQIEQTKTKAELIIKKVANSLKKSIRFVLPEEARASTSNETAVSIQSGKVDKKRDVNQEMINDINEIKAGIANINLNQIQGKLTEICDSLEREGFQGEDFETLNKQLQNTYQQGDVNKNELINNLEAAVQHLQTASLIKDYYDIDSKWVRTQYENEKSQLVDDESMNQFTIKIANQLIEKLEGDDRKLNANEAYVDDYVIEIMNYLDDLIYIDDIIANSTSEMHTPVELHTSEIKETQTPDDLNLLLNELEAGTELQNIKLSSDMKIHPQEQTNSNEQVELHEARDIEKEEKEMQQELTKVLTKYDAELNKIPNIKQELNRLNTGDDAKTNLISYINTIFEINDEVIRNEFCNDNAEKIVKKGEAAINRFAENYEDLQLDNANDELHDYFNKKNNDSKLGLSDKDIDKICEDTIKKWLSGRSAT